MAAVAAVVACCALLPAIAVGTGLASAAVGAAARYWPLTLAGVAVAIWAGVRIARTVRRRQRLREPGVPDSTSSGARMGSGPGGKDEPAGERDT
ncbi:MAG: hypothetical protein ACRDIZ_02175 [Actinomycetota bacterium]